MDKEFIEQQRLRLSSHLERLQDKQRLEEELAIQGEASNYLVEQKGQKITQLLKALQRISNNRYEFCEKCGQEIEQRRLEIIPTATTCVTCMKIHG